MVVQLSDKSNTPIYQQLVDFFIQKIQSGSLSAGLKLPTVRELAKDNQMSQGTVKHAYDMLEQLGYIEKSQGRGTFVCNNGAEHPHSAKDLAMKAIDDLLDKMESLSFSVRETRIFLDLKLREREHLIRNVQIGAVDCSPEALSVMCQQISALPHVDVYEYLLSSVVGAPSLFHTNADIVVTTPTHVGELAVKLPEDVNLIRLVMGISRKTLLELARIPVDCQIGILCVSERFAHIIARTCEKYGVLAKPPKVAYLGDGAGMQQLLEQSDQIILPPNYLKFATHAEQSLISRKVFKQAPIVFQYQIDRGSLLHLEEQVEKIYQLHQKQI